MSPEEINRIVAAGQEARTIEFKSAGAWTDPSLRGQITKSCLALANTRDGGIILVGLKEDAARPGYHILDALSTPQRDSFNPDTLIPQVNAHANPHVDLAVIHHQSRDNCNIVGILVSEFRDVPILCAKDIYGGVGQVLASKGRLLVRTRRNAETTELQEPEDLRELVDLAIDKGLEAYFRRRLIEEGVAGPADDDLFDQELGPIRH